MDNQTYSFFSVMIVSPDLWLSFLTKMHPKDQRDKINLYIYGCLVGAAIVFGIIRAYLFLVVSLRCSERLHDKMVVAVLQAPVLFFDANPVGRILNRFSKDIGGMDDLLPVEFLWASYLCLYVCSATILSAVTNVWLCFTCIPLILLFIYLAIYYLKSAREIRRLEALTCSPVYSLIADTVAGLEVIHSSKMEDNFLQRFYK